MIVLLTQDQGMDYSVTAIVSVDNYMVPIIKNRVKQGEKLVRHHHVKANQVANGLLEFDTDDPRTEKKRRRIKFERDKEREAREALTKYIQKLVSDCEIDYVEINDPR